MSSRKSILTSVLGAALIVGGCAASNNRQLADMQLELRVERELLKETRAELQEIIKKLEPVLAFADLLDGNLDLLTSGFAEEDSPKEQYTAGEGPVSGGLFDGKIVRVSDNKVTITRSLVDQILENPTQVARGARIVPSIKNGKANGFKLYAIRPSSIYAKLGIMNGDTLHSINGFDLTSPDKALEVYTKIRDADTLVLSLTRRGKPLTHTIEIR